jgi:hypothetical protein
MNMAIDYNKAAKTLRKVLNRVEKFKEGSRSLKRVKVEVISYSGFDIKYKDENGRTKTVRLYDTKKGNRPGYTPIKDVQVNELRSIYSELSRLYQTDINPKRYIQQSKVGFQGFRPREADKESDTKMKSAIAHIKEMGISPNEINLDDKEFIKNFDPWDTGGDRVLGLRSGSPLRNLFYHAFGAQSTDPIYVAAFKVWLQKNL